MKDLVFYTFFMCIGLGVAYYASLPVKEGASERISIFSIEPTGIASLAYKNEGIDVVVTQREDNKRFWVEFEKTETKIERPKPGDKPEPHKEETTKQSFLASDGINPILDELHPFQALRVIGKDMKPEELKEFGLDTPKESLVVTGKGGEQFKIELGKKSYGSRNRFVRESKGGRIILIDGKSFETLERANFRLFERQLIDLEMDDVTHVEIKAGGATRRLDHTQRDAKGKLQWSEDAEGAKPKTTYMSFMNKIDRLRLTSYSSEEELTKLKEVQPFLQLAFEEKGKVKDLLSFYKTNDGKPEYWVRSNFLGTFGRVSGNRIGPIESDITNIVGESK